MWNFKFRSLFGELGEHATSLPVTRRGCDIAGCQHPGDYRAPKSREDLRSYYWFCLDHVREYNQKWDFFKGMSQGEIEHHMHKTVVWDRPTWRSTQAGINEERLRQHVYDQFMSEDGGSGFSFKTEKEEARIDISSIPHPAVEALAVLGLAPPIQWEEVRARYKLLVKKYHPDIHKDNKEAEEELKKVTLAYSILKLSYQDFITLEGK